MNQGEAMIRDDRRRHPRTSFEGPVLIEAPQAVLQAKGLDVSAGGIRLESERPLPFDLELDVYFELRGLAVESRAKLVRREGLVHCLAFQQGSRVSVPARRFSFGPSSVSLVA